MAKKKQSTELTKRDLILNQIALAGIVISKANINIVTCGHCGEVNLYKTTEQFFTCYDCKRKMSVDDCEDLFYSGIENNKRYQE